MLVTLPSSAIRSTAVTVPGPGSSTPSSAVNLIVSHSRFYSHRIYVAREQPRDLQRHGWLRLNAGCPLRLTPKLALRLASTAVALNGDVLGPMLPLSKDANLTF